MECKFCNVFEYAKGSRKIADANVHLKVRLEELWTKNRVCDFRHLYPSRPLNYCPECGKKLKGAR